MSALLRRLFAICVACACVLATCADAAVPDDEEDVYFLLMGQADEAIKNEKYQDAVSRLVEAMGVRPDSPTNVLLMSNLGMVYSMMGKDSLALETLDRAHELAPSMVTVLENRGRISLKMARDADAYADFSKVIALDSLNMTARYYRGMIALYQGNAEVAGGDFEVLAGCYPESDETLVAMATYNALLRRDREAIPYYKKLIEKDPSPEFYASLAGCYLGTDNLTDAAETIAKGLELYPQDAELYYYRAWLNRDRYLLKDARADAQTAIRLGADARKVQRLFEK